MNVLIACPSFAITLLRARAERRLLCVFCGFLNRNEDESLRGVDGYGSTVNNYDVRRMVSTGLILREKEKLKSIALASGIDLDLNNWQYV